MTSFPPLTLLTPRLLLRPLTATDNHALLGIFSDPQTMRYFSCAPWTELAQADESLANTARDYHNGSALRLAITLAGSGELLGSCTLFALHPANRRCELGYILGRPHWGHGYMTEALTALLNYGFTALELNRIEADIDPRNVASARLLQRLAFRREGYMRERWIVNGEVCDTEYFGLLHSDWTAAQR
jgi:RimJ/RimL family protein N-acetyltransferase